MNVLALDLGIHTGWALREAGRIEHGADTFDLRRGESPGMRWLRFDRWLEEVVTVPHGGGEARVELVVYEAVLGRFAKGQAQTFIASNFAGRVEALCAQLNIEHQPVIGSTLKKWTTGKGNAGKPLMLAAVNRRWNVRIDDDNEADAYALLQYALAELVPANR